MNIFARLVRVCMGTSAIAEHKLGQGTQLVVLGIELAVKTSGLTLWPSEDKVTKWTHRITRALKEGKLSPGDASKLSGALQWATQAIFKKLGRAMIRPIIKQSYARWSKIGKELELALRWWLEVLQCGLRYILFLLLSRVNFRLSCRAPGKSASGSKCPGVQCIFIRMPEALHPEWRPS